MPAIWGKKWSGLSKENKSPLSSEMTSSCHHFTSDEEWQLSPLPRLWCSTVRDGERVRKSNRQSYLCQLLSRAVWVQCTYVATDVRSPGEVSASLCTQLYWSTNSESKDAGGKAEGSEFGQASFARRLDTKRSFCQLEEIEGKGDRTVVEKGLDRVGDGRVVAGSSSTISGCAYANAVGS